MAAGEDRHPVAILGLGDILGRHELRAPGRLELPELLPELLSGGRASFSVEKRYLRKDGEVVWFETSSRVLLNDQGEIEEVVSVSRDISERAHGFQPIHVAGSPEDGIGAVEQQGQDSEGGGRKPVQVEPETALQTQLPGSCESVARKKLDLQSISLERLWLVKRRPTSMQRAIWIYWRVSQTRQKTGPIRSAKIQSCSRL